MSKKDEALKLAEDALKRVRTQDMELVQLSMIALAAIQEALAEQPAQDNTYGYAKYLAEAMFKRHFASDEHYASGRVVWGVNDTVIGILTQIDNMVADMVRRPAQQEPVAWADECRISLVTAIHFLASDYENALGVFRDDTEARRKAEGDIAYARKIAAKWNWNGTSPPAQRTWVGLTDDEIDVMANDFEEGYVFLYRSFTRAIEAKLRERNT